MTLKDMSAEYTESAKLIRTRVRELRAEERNEIDPIAAKKLHRRISELTPLLRECREIAELTARYYDRSYHKNERYTL